MPTLTLERFTADRDQEGPCDCCGYPLYRGDTVTYNSDNGRFYCGSVCADKDANPLHRGDHTDALDYLDRYGTAR